MAQQVSLFDAAASAKRAAAKDVRATMFARCRAALDQFGDDVAGFALVVWDRSGDLRSAYETSIGPIRPALVPTLAADALNRHVAVVVAEQRLTGTWNDGDAV
jgi:hypothetical protein